MFVQRIGKGIFHVRLNGLLLAVIRCCFYNMYHYTKSNCDIKEYISTPSNRIITVVPVKREKILTE